MSDLLWGIVGIVAGVIFYLGIYELILWSGDRRRARARLAAFDAHIARLRAQNPDLWRDR